MQVVKRIPKDFPVQPLTTAGIQSAGLLAVCGHCGLAWDDSIPTSYTPAPSARCPFEAFHVHTEPRRVKPTAVMTKLRGAAANKHAVNLSWQEATQLLDLRRALARAIDDEEHGDWPDWVAEGRKAIEAVDGA